MHTKYVSVSGGSSSVLFGYAPGDHLAAKYKVSVIAHTYAVRAEVRCVSKTNWKAAH